jgi:hypothetical protein
MTTSAPIPATGSDPSMRRAKERSDRRCPLAGGSRMLRKASAAGVDRASRRSDARTCPDSRTLGRAYTAAWLEKPPGRSESHGDRPRNDMPLTVIPVDSRVLAELEEAEDAAANRRADELNPLRLLEIAELYRQARCPDEARRADVLAGRAVYAGAVE